MSFQAFAFAMTIRFPYAEVPKSVYEGALQTCRGCVQMPYQIPCRSALNVPANLMLHIQAPMLNFGLSCALCRSACTLGMILSEEQLPLITSFE